jgi:hypothetical protein
MRAVTTLGKPGGQRRRRFGDDHVLVPNLNLLLHGVHADEILALTFTEKATLEMQSPSGLGQTVQYGYAVGRRDPPPVSDGMERTIFPSVHFHLDGFSSKILRSDPYRYA